MSSKIPQKKHSGRRGIWKKYPGEKTPHRMTIPAAKPVCRPTVARKTPYRLSFRPLSCPDRCPTVLRFGISRCTIRHLSSSASAAVKQQKDENRITDCLSHGCENGLKIAYFGEEGSMVNSGRIFRPVFVIFFPTEKCGAIGQHMKSTETDCPLCFVRSRPVISPFCRRKAAKGFPR